MLLYGQDTKVADWVCRQLKMKPYPLGLYKAVGIIRGEQFIGGVVWHNYHEDNYGKPMLIEATIATIDKHWATRHNLREIFQYPFTQLRVGRVQASCHRKAKRVRSTLQRLGFSYEGICRQAHPQGGDVAHYSMLRNECRWIKNGKIVTFSSGSTRPNSDRAGANCEQ